MEQIDFIEGQIEEVEARIEEGIETTEPLILTIPGIGHILGAQIASEIGDVHRFRNASAVVSYAGINPSVSQSGKFSSSENHITKQNRPTFDAPSIWQRPRSSGSARLFGITTIRREQTGNPIGRPS